MDGEIGVDSAPGVGSTFWFTLTARDRDRAAAEPSLPRLDGLRVLAVDDNPTNRLVLSDLLRQLGCRGRHAPTAAPPRWRCWPAPRRTTSPSST